jgi:hypothetical protein
MQTGTRNRGFASMDAEKQREIARKGGKAAHQKGTAHEFTSDEARAAGRKGGERVSSNREHMSRIGRIGGKSSANRRSTTDRSDPEPRQSAGHPGDGGGHHGGEDFGGNGAGMEGMEGSAGNSHEPAGSEPAIPSPS